MPSYTPANHAYHPPRPETPLGNCKQCNQQIIFRGSVPCCGTCGLPQTKEGEAVLAKAVEPAPPVKRGPGRPKKQSI